MDDKVVYKGLRKRQFINTIYKGYFIVDGYADNKLRVYRERETIENKTYLTQVYEKTKNPRNRYNEVRHIEVKRNTVDECIAFIDEREKS